MVKKSSQQGSNIDIEIAVCHGWKNGSSHVVDPTGIAVKTVNCFHNILYALFSVYTTVDYSPMNISTVGT